MERIGLFIVDSKCGFIGKYITVLLDDISKCMSSIIILLVGGDLDNEEKKKLKRYSEHIIISSKGSVSCAINEVMTSDAILSLIKTSDELVIFDDSFYGPFVSFSKVFAEMESSKADFWGITKRAVHRKGEEIIREYLQKYFIVFRKKMLEKDLFWNFFKDDVSEEKGVDRTSSDFDYGITWFFSENDFSYDVYVKDDKLNSEATFNYNHVRYNPYLMLAKYKMPVLSRDCFSKKKKLSYGNGEEISRVFSYIKERFGYDVDIIWEDLLRKVNISVIKDNLGLNYIVPEREAFEIQLDKKIIVIAHLYYEDLVEDCVDYLERVPDFIDILVTSSKKNILDTVQEKLKRGKHNRIETKLVSNRGRDVGAIFVECADFVMDYDYLCFVHDKKTAGGRGFATTGISFHNMVWANMLSSSGYIKNVIHLFEENNRLGLLSPPIPIHSGYEILIPDGWTLNYEIAEKWVKKLNLNVPFDENKQPFAFSTCFWCRTDALKKIWEAGLKLEDFKEMGQRVDGELNHALERLIIYVAQDAGYYSAIVENSFYASLMQQNLYIHLRKQLGKSERRRKKKNNERLNLYLKSKRKIYVYGAGIEGEKAQNIIEEIGFEIDAYIVSDNYINSCKSNLNPIIKLSDADLDNAGIVIAMNKANEAEARENLKKIGYMDAIPLFMK